jgi:hypothetical protein
MNELVFEVTQEEDGGFVAECLTDPIYTQGDDWASLRLNVRDAVSGYFFDSKHPRQIRLHLVRDELVPA